MYGLKLCTIYDYMFILLLYNNKKKMNFNVIP